MRDECLQDYAQFEKRPDKSPEIELADVSSYVCDADGNPTSILFDPSTGHEGALPDFHVIVGMSGELVRVGYCLYCVYNGSPRSTKSIPMSIALLLSVRPWRRFDT